MALVELEVSSRSETGKNINRRLRKSGQIPMVIYGHGEPVSLAVDGRTFLLALQRGDGVRSILRLKGTDVEGQTAVIRAIQRDPVTDRIIHCDLSRVGMNEAVIFIVPVRVVGSSRGVKAGGVLNQLVRSVELKCTPTSVPTHIDVDVTNLGLGKNLTVGDIVVPEGTSIVGEKETVVVQILIPRGIKADEEEETGDAVTEPELIRKGKQEEAEG